MLTGDVWESLLRLLLALISGGIIGFERSMKGMDAGFRTHILVCMSSCAIMITNIHTYLFYGTGDPVRMPAQVISGIGFLGAGCILVTRQHRIKGVTTAAGIWTAACLGLCIGAGDYVIAVFVLVVALITMTLLKKVHTKINTKTKYMRFYMEIDSVDNVTNLMRHIRSKGIMTNDLEFIDNKQSTNIAIAISLQLKKAEPVEDVIADLEQLRGVNFAMEL